MILPPKLDKIDHVHIQVPNRKQAAEWYEEVLGFSAVEAALFWADDPGGPLTLSNPSGTIHLALFEREKPSPTTAIAFGVQGHDFLEWKSYLAQRNLLVSFSDHSLTWSLYFCDPYGNNHEITTDDHDYVTQQLHAEKS